MTGYVIVIQPNHEARTYLPWSVEVANLKGKGGGGVVLVGGEQEKSSREERV